MFSLAPEQSAEKSCEKTRLLVLFIRTLREKEKNCEEQNQCRHNRNRRGCKLIKVSEAIL